MMAGTTIETCFRENKRAWDKCCVCSKKIKMVDYIHNGIMITKNSTLFHCFPTRIQWVSRFVQNSANTSCVPRSKNVRVASRGQFKGITVVYQAAEEKSNACSVESGPGCLDSMSVCGTAH
jgi:hypothetical protein